MFLNPDFISPSEAGRYSRFMRTFQKDDLLFTEGEDLDNSFHLVRSGTVGVFRLIGGEELLIDRINAVSFVGEIEIFIPGPRLGTVRVLSKNLTTYRFEKSDLKVILSEPELSELLLLRLTGDLKDFSDRYVKNEDSINRLLVEKENTTENLTCLFTAVNQALMNMPDLDQMSEENSVYIKGINNMIRKYLAIKMPEVNFHIETDPAANFRKMYEENLIPEELVKVLINRK